MRARPKILINTPDIELWPGGLLRGRSNADARSLSQARQVLRRKRDGRYLAAVLPQGLVPLIARFEHETGLDAALRALRATQGRSAGIERVGQLPLDRLQERLEVIGLDAGYAQNTGLSLVPEPDRLAFAGFDRYRRPLWLHSDAARGWEHMRQAALGDGVVLEAISGYRSHAYQLGIFERKLARGLNIADILWVNAAPGYSEHHSGRALDIGAPGEPPAEESFEDSAAFAWLIDHAAGYGFIMSYPRD
ncbi:MAG: D-alanyl-D-alanine carboxypeptidase family protein, partial [Lysobacter sp.]|nr:D-alanyl-D-alanine carboxypeptidase family protein [Lysobacter sp.]